MILYHVTEKSKLESILTYGLIPQVGPRSSKLNEECGIFLFATIEDMETALSSWLGEEFDEDTELVSLIVELPDDFPLIETVGYERFSYLGIPNIHISYLRDE
jgi:hypothetical protein